MAITSHLARAILQEHLHKPIRGEVLLIGRQTVTLSPEEAVSIVEEQGIPIRPHCTIEIDSETVGSVGRGFITDRTFFGLFSDARVLALDVSDYEGAEVIHNLNDLLPVQLNNRCEFIFNGSCLDNLFDPAAALKNMSRLLKQGGRVIHIEHGSPIQGAYIMYSPAFFFDYYALNTFADCKVYACFFDHVLGPWRVFLWEPFTYDEGRIRLTEHMLDGERDILNLVIAEKAANSTTDKHSVQAFYRIAHSTENKPYEDAFWRFKHSPRPLMSLPALSMEERQIKPGFVPIGVLA